MQMHVHEAGNSSLTAAMSVQNFKRVTGCDIRVAFKCGATNSAKAMGIYDRVGSIEEGRDANIIFVDDEFLVHGVYFLGEKVEDIRQ